MLRCTFARVFMPRIFRTSMHAYTEQMLKRAATTITGIDTIHTAHSTDSTTHGAGTSTQHTHHIHTPDNPHPTKRKNDILWEELFDTEIAPDPSSSPGLQQPQTDVPADANPIAGTPPSHTDTLTHPHIPTTSSPPSSSPSLDQLQEASHPAPPTSAPYINKFNHNLSLNAHPCTIHQVYAHTHA